ncbi:MAG: hypothetical protein ACOCP8_06440 [archaeon]
MNIGINLVHPFTISLFIIFIYLLFTNFKKIKKELKKALDKKTITLLFIIILISIFIRLKIERRINMFDDSVVSQQDAFKLLNLRLPEHHRPAGTQILFAISFLLFGIDMFNAVNIMWVFGLLTIPVIFFLSYKLTEDKKISIITTGLFSLEPIHIIWSNTPKETIISMFFINLFLLILLINLDEKYSINLTILTITTTIFLTLFRIENFVIYLPLCMIFLYYLFKSDRKTNKLKKHYKKYYKKFLTIIFLVFILSLPNFMTQMKENIIIDRGTIEKTHINQFNQYLKIYPSENKFINILFYSISLIGLIIMTTKNMNQKKFMFLFTIIILFTSIFLISYNYSTHDRFIMYFYPYIFLFFTIGLMELNKKIFKNNRYTSLILFTIIFIILSNSLYITFEREKENNTIKDLKKTINYIKENLKECNIYVEQEARFFEIEYKVNILEFEPSLLILKHEFKENQCNKVVFSDHSIKRKEEIINAGYELELDNNLVKTYPIYNIFKNQT